MSSVAGLLTIRVFTASRPENEEYKVHFPPDARALDVKTKIAQLAGTTAEMVSLLHSGKKMPDESTLTTLGIKDGDCVVFVVRKPKTPTSPNEPKDGVYRRPFNTSPSTPSETSSSSGTALPANILTINVKPMDGDVFQVSAPSNESALDMKRRIAAQKSHLPAEQQQIVLNGEILREDSKTLKELGFDNDSTIVVALRKGSKVDSGYPKKTLLTITPLDNDAFQVEVKLGLKVADLKSAIALKRPDFLAARQTLILAGNVLLDESTIIESKITEASQIVLTLKKDGALPRQLPSVTQTESFPEIDSLRRHPRLPVLAGIYREDPSSIDTILPAMAKCDAKLGKVLEANKDAFIRMLTEEAAKAC